MTVSNYFCRLGLNWKQVMNKKQSVGEYRKDLLRTFIIKFNKVMTAINQYPVNCCVVLVCTNKSYIQASGYLYIKREEAAINRSNNRGERLIIMHAITPDGVMVERENLTNVPVSDLHWRGDSCHPQAREDNKITCEMIWTAASRKGDYHDNMNSDMFIKWFTEKLILCFERLHPGKQMVLIMDNAPYHQKCEIGTLSSKTKKELIEICKAYNIEYIDVKWNNNG
jgi:hypothetical protein